MGEEDVHWVAPPFIVLARPYADLFELVKRPAVDVQDPGVLANALEERGTIGELEVVKRRIQGRCAADHAIEVQCVAKGGVPRLAGRAEGCGASWSLSHSRHLMLWYSVVVNSPLRGSMHFA